MFRKTILTFSFTLSLLAIAFALSIFHRDERADIEYKKLAESSLPTRRDGLTTFSEQWREGVVKEIWFRDQSTLRTRIDCKDSELLFLSDESKFEMIEELKDVSCIMQEELFYLLPDGREAIKEEDGHIVIKNSSPKVILEDTAGMIPVQHIRYLKARKARYNYNSQLFVADDVLLWKYRLRGHELPSTLGGVAALMSGTAKSVEFSFKGDKFDFKAERLKTTFDPRVGAL